MGKLIDIIIDKNINLHKLHVYFLQLRINLGNVYFSRVLRIIFQ
jgi:hypothetical protein